MEDKKITIYEIAEIAGVSAATVSRALRADPKASVKTIEKIKKIAKETGYYHDSLAKWLREKKTNIIGVVLNEINNPFYSQLLGAISNISNDIGYSIIISYSNCDHNREKKNIANLLSLKVGGIIIFPIDDKSENIDILVKRNTNTVIIESYPYYKEISYVFINHEKGASLATEYLIKNGHKNILLITGHDNFVTSKFLKGYRDTLIRYKINFNKDLVVHAENFSIDGGYKSFKKIVAKNGLRKTLKFTAVMTIDDLLAMGVYKASREINLNIPKDLSIIGYDNLKVTEILHPSLTTINTPRKMIGTESVKMILERIENKSKENKIVNLEPEIVIRNSVENLS